MEVFFIIVYLLVGFFVGLYELYFKYAKGARYLTIGELLCCIITSPFTPILLVGAVIGKIGSIKIVGDK